MVHSPLPMHLPQLVQGIPVVAENSLGMQLANLSLVANITLAAFCEGCLKLSSSDDDIVVVVGEGFLDEEDL